jgi:hypothetical protein
MEAQVVRQIQKLFEFLWPLDALSSGLFRSKISEHERRNRSTRHVREFGELVLSQKKQLLFPLHGIWSEDL